jgi:predicted RNA methylase
MLDTVKEVLFNEHKPSNQAAREAAILMMIIALDILLYADKLEPKLAKKIIKNPLPKLPEQLKKERDISTQTPEIEAPLADISTPEGVLQRCTIEGKIVKLPPVQLDRKLYVDVANRLVLIGGKWKGHSTMGFVFPQDPTDLLNQIAYGEKRNLKKEYQFFATPDELANKLVKLANIKKGETILEPSAGQGAIINAVARLFQTSKVDCYELMDVNQSFLRKNNNAHLLGSDFLTSDVEKKYDVIIANPPFAKNLDVEHIRAMYERLSKKGRIVTVASKHWQMSDNRKEKEFRNWLEEIGAYVEEIPTGTFAESGTQIGACIIIINK